MTINNLLECVLGKSCVKEGKYGDATPWNKGTVDISNEICDRLESNGFERHGWETLYSGITGEPIKAQIFMGPVYYQRLKHMVSDKVHSRAQGQVTTLTRQPLEGEKILLCLFKKMILNSNGNMNKHNNIALVKCKNFASPYTMGKTIGSGKLLKLLVPNLTRNCRTASGKTRRYGNNLKDIWTILSGIPNSLRK